MNRRSSRSTETDEEDDILHLQDTSIATDIKDKFSKEDRMSIFFLGEDDNKQAS